MMAPPGGGSGSERVAAHRDQPECAPSCSDIIRVAPQVEQGKVVGFRDPARPRIARTFDALGLVPGDVVTEINGVVLDDPSKGSAGFRGARRGDAGKRDRASRRRSASPRDRHDAASEPQERIASDARNRAARSRGVGSRAAALDLDRIRPSARRCSPRRSGRAPPRRSRNARRYRARSSRRTIARPTSASSPIRFSRSSAGRSSSIRACARRSRSCRTRRCRPTRSTSCSNRALEVHGFVALDSGSAIEIVPDANARFGEGDDYVSQAIVLENIGAAQLVPILRPLLPQSAHLAAHPASNALIIADRAAEHRPHDAADPADGHSRHRGDRGHRARERVGRRGRAHHSSSLNQAAQAARRHAARAGDRGHAHEQRAAERRERVAPAVQAR